MKPASLSWQAIRDTLLAAGVAAGIAFTDYIDAWLSANPLSNTVLTAAAVALVGILRRLFNPTIPVAAVEKAANDLPQWPSPGGTVGQFAPAPDLDEEQFLSACAAQCLARAPGGRNAVKGIDPASIAAILTWLFNHREDILALIEKARGLFAFWFKRKLQNAVAAAAVATGNVSAVRGLAVVDGTADWLLISDRSTLERVRRIAANRG